LPIRAIVELFVLRLVLVALNTIPITGVFDLQQRHDGVPIEILIYSFMHTTEWLSSGLAQQFKLFHALDVLAIRALGFPSFITLKQVVYLISYDRFH